MLTIGRWSPAWVHWYRRVFPAYWVFLFLSTHLPNLRLDIPLSSDKRAHVIAFGILAFLFWRFVETFRRPVPSATVYYAAVVLVVYAGLDEYLQQFVGRGTDWMDWLADLLGLGVVLVLLEARRRWVARVGKAVEIPSV